MVDGWLANLGVCYSQFELICICTGRSTRAVADGRITSHFIPGSYKLKTPRLIDHFILHVSCIRLTPHKLSNSYFELCTYRVLHSDSRQCLSTCTPSTPAEAVPPNLPPRYLVCSPPRRAARRSCLATRSRTPSARRCCRRWLSAICRFSARTGGRRCRRCCDCLARRRSVCTDSSFNSASHTHSA